jgi:hypothetical protein
VEGQPFTCGICDRIQETKRKQAASGWVGVRCQAQGRNALWVNAAYPGVEIRRTPYHTALRKYYVLGLPIARKFYRLNEAQKEVEAFLKRHSLHAGRTTAIQEDPDYERCD